MSEKLKVQIPFAGFYETHHDMMITDALEQEFNYNYETQEEQEVPDFWMADIDFKAIQTEYVKRYVANFADEYDLKLEFDEMTSPREYNFSTDKLYVLADRERIDEVRKQVYEHGGWADYVKENFTSYDGFISFISNDVTHEDWTKDVLSEAQYEVILRYWLNQIRNPFGADMWYDAELHLMEDEEMCNWDSIIEAVEVIEKYLKENE